MKTLVLFGDSIRKGYDKSIQKTLEGKAKVVFHEGNDRFAAYLLRVIPDYYNDIKNADVVHWNAGLWDCLRLLGEDAQTPLDIYAYYIDRICLRIKRLCPNAKVIFATSTRVLSEQMPPNFIRSNEDIEHYNAVAVEIAKKHGFEIDDLYAVSASLPDEAHSDATHYYTPMGTEAFTNQVLSCVLPALGIDETLTYREEMYTDQPHGI